MQTIKAIYDEGNFTLLQPIPVTQRYNVFITFVEPLENETVKKTQTNKLPRSTALGLWENKVWISDDFNEPLEEMKEYME